VEVEIRVGVIYRVGSEVVDMLLLLLLLLRLEEMTRVLSRRLSLEEVLLLLLLLLVLLLLFRCLTRELVELIGRKRGISASKFRTGKPQGEAER